jgi:O-antigen/teichoic acid export membrane protein
LRTILSFSALVFLVQVSSTVLLQLDRIVLGTIASVSLVSYYVIPALLAQRLQMVTVKLTVVLFPAVTDLVARGDTNRVVRLYRRATAMLFVGLSSIVTPLIVGAPKLLDLWLGGDFADKSGNILRLLLVTCFLVAMTTVAYYTALAFARPGVPAIFYGIGAVANVVLIFLLIPPFGLMGAAVAYLASAVPLLGLVWFAETRLLVISTWHWLPVLGRTAPMVALEVVLTLVVMHLSTNLLEAVLGIGLTVIAGLLLYFFVFADDADRGTLDAVLPLRLTRGVRRRASDA